MPLAERTLSSDTASTNGATTLSISPTGMQEGDWLLFGVVSAGGTGAHSNTAGDLSRATAADIAGGTVTVASTWKKKCAAGEAGPYTFSFGGSTRRAAIGVVCWSGGDPTDIVEEAPAGTASGASASSLAVTGVDPAADGGVHIVFEFSRTAGAVAQDFDPITNYDEKFEVSSSHATNANANLAISQRALPNANATGDITFGVATADRLSGASILLVAGQSTVDLTAATLTFAGVATDPVPGQVTVSLTAATVTLAGVVVDPDPQPVTVALTAATMALVGVATDPDPQPVSVSLTAASITLTAVPPTPQSAINLMPAVITLAGVVVDPVPGQVTVGLTAAPISLSGVAVDPVPQPVTVSLVSALMTLSAVSLSPGGVSTVDLEPVILALTGQPVDPVPGAVTVSLTFVSLTIAAVQVNPVPQPVTTTLTPVVLTLVVVGVVPEPQPVTVVLVPATMVFVVPALSLTGQGSVNLVPAIISFTAVPLLWARDPDAIALLTVPTVVVVLPASSYGSASAVPTLVVSDLSDEGVQQTSLDVTMVEADR